MNKETLFRKSSLNSISSPEQLNDYIKVANPSVWLVVAALFVLLAAVLVWGITGSLPTTINTKGVTSQGEMVCYINPDDANAVELGQQVSMMGGDGSAYQGQIVDIGNMPMSVDEITLELNSEYLTYALVSEQFAVKITITVDVATVGDNMLFDVSIVTDRVKPINFLLGR